MVLVTCGNLSNLTALLFVVTNRVTLTGSTFLLLL